MSNPFQEPAFEASIYHYFLFKANQAATAAAREAAEKKTLAAGAVPTTPLAVLATTATTNDGNKKTPATANPSKSDASGVKDGAGQMSDKSNKNEPGGAPPQQKPAGAAPTAPQKFAATPPPTIPGLYPYPNMVPPPPQVPMQQPLRPSPSVNTAPGKQSGGGPTRPTKQAPAKSLAAAPTETAKSPAAAQETPESIASGISAKYDRLAAAMKDEFPLYTTMVPPNAQWLAPQISMRYAHFPQVHNEIGMLRQRVFMLEQQLQQQQGQNQYLKQALATEQQARRKRSLPTEEDKLKAAKKMKFSASRGINSRSDVPDDVKEQVAKLKKDASNEKRAMKGKIARLERKAKKLTEAVAAAEEAPKVEPTPQVKPSPAAAAPAAAAAGAPTKPSPPPKPVGLPVCFESRFKELVDYKIANNTTRVPGRIPGLGRWVSDIRRVYKQSKERPEILEPKKFAGSVSDLTQERIDRLNKLGFEWDVAKKVVPWEERFNEIVAYKEKYGNANVPRNWKENPSLGEWVHMQRKLQKKNSKIMQGEREEKLNSIGFVWSGSGPKMVSWEERLEECRNFRRKHGHLNVPPPPNPKKASEKEAAAAQSPEERSFQSWCQRQRDNNRRFQAGQQVNFDKKRQKQLNDMGFNWLLKKQSDNAEDGRSVKRKDEDVYSAQIAKLQRVKELYGDCNELKNIEKAFPGDTKLYNWMKTQRKHWKNQKKGEWNSLTNERRLMLEALGFNFEPRKHYAPPGSKKKEASEASDGATEMPDAEEVRAEIGVPYD